MFTYRFMAPTLDRLLTTSFEEHVSTLARREGLRLHMVTPLNDGRVLLAFEHAEPTEMVSSDRAAVLRELRGEAVRQGLSPVLNTR